MKEKIAIVGAGKVGTAVGYLLKKKGYVIASICARHEESLKRAREIVGGKPFFDAAEASKLGDVVLLTTGDDWIKNVCQSIAKAGGFRTGQKVIHMSGASSLDVLAPAEAAGAEILSIHPLQAFATVEGAIKQLPGTVFGVTAREESMEWAYRFVSELGGKPICISDDQKILYHAAACVVSNYFVTLMWIGKKMAMHVGMPEDVALSAYWPLVQGTSKNIEKNGPVGALTGPIVRGDVKTVSGHRRKIAEELKELLDVYNVLGRHTVEIALEKGTIDRNVAEKLLKVLC